MTLREIAWAARERRRLDGELIAVQMAWLALKFNGEQIDPYTLNPYGDNKPRPELVKSEAQQRAENAAGWGMVEKFLFGRKMKERL